MKFINAKATSLLLIISAAHYVGAATTFNFSSASILTEEFVGTVKVTNLRAGDTTSPQNVNVSTTNETALAGQDYAAVLTSVAFDAGETTKVVEIPILDDYFAEPDSTFLVHLTGLPSGATSTKSVARITIRDDERPGGIDFSWSSDLGLPPLAPGEVKYAEPKIIVRQPDGRMVLNVGIYDCDLLYVWHQYILRINPDGAVDPTYTIQESVPSTPGGFFGERRVKVMPDGKLLVWESESTANNEFLGYRLNYRLNQDGSEDSNFNVSLTSFSGGGADVVPQPDGKILVTGDSAGAYLNGERMPTIFRLNNQGSIDDTFNAPDIIGSIRVLANGLFLIEGYAVRPTRLYRLHTNGELDTSFNPPTNIDLNFLHELPNGQLLVTSPTTNSRKLYRLNLDGSIDPNFSVGTAAGVNQFSSVGSIDKVIEQPEDKLLFIGIFQTFNGEVRNSIVRLNSDGSVDPTFQTGQGFVGVPGTSGDPGQLWYVRQLPQGRLLVGGLYDKFNGQRVTAPIVLNPDGTRDTSFEGTVTDGFGEVWPIGAWTLTGDQDSPFIITGYGLGRLRMDLPFRLVSISSDSAGTPHITANALPGRSYTLQTSENLSNWTDLTTQLAATNRIDFSDTSELHQPIRFYRAKQN